MLQNEAEKVNTIETIETNQVVRTRFAPSPTGPFHLGGARTALVNWLFARSSCGGKFFLRIEDTDKQRSQRHWEEEILCSLLWMDLSWDSCEEMADTNGICLQSSRIQRHREVVQSLLTQGKAYYCDCSSVLISKGANKKGLDQKEPDKARCNCKQKELQSGAVRLLTDGQSIKYTDMIVGEVQFPPIHLHDWIMLRNDGTPTYMLSVVVDDHDMGITHIIRGQDHLQNTPRQMQLYQAMSWNAPLFGHVPLLLSESGAKLSKSDVSTQSFHVWREQYMSQVVLSYLLNLGLGFDNELINMSTAIRKFNTDRIGRSPSRIDYKKLDSISKKHLRGSDGAFNWFYNKLLDNDVEIDELLASRIWPELAQRYASFSGMFDAYKALVTDPFDSYATATNIDAKLVRSWYEYCKNDAQKTDRNSDAIWNTMKASLEHIGSDMKNLSNCLYPVLCGHAENRPASLKIVIYALGWARVMQRMEYYLSQVTNNNE